MDIKKVAETHQDLIRQIDEKRSVWIQRVLVASSTLFGILISLKSTTGGSLCTRLAFAISIALLALGILTLTVALYSQIEVLKRFRKKYTQETQNAVREHREVGAVSVQPNKFYVVCEKIAYICLALSILSLSAYSILLIFG